jgi:hypothetical protein
MDRYLLQDYWGSLVRNFKDSEKQHYVSGYRAELLANTILDYVLYTHFKQYKLFMEQRGEEFERMLFKLKQQEFEEESIQRFLENEDLWKATLEMGEQ